MITRFTLHLIYMTLMAFIYVDWMLPYGLDRGPLHHRGRNSESCILQEGEILIDQSN